MPVAAWTVALDAATIALYRLKVSSVNNGTSSLSMAREATVKDAASSVAHANEQGKVSKRLITKSLKTLENT